MPRRGRAKPFLTGLVKFVALILVAGGVGVALGMGLSALAGDNNAPPTAPIADAQTTGADARESGVGTGAGAVPTVPTGAATTPSVPTQTVPATSAATATTASPPPPRQTPGVRVDVLDARLFTDESPSGVQEQRARMTVRVRAANAGRRRVTLPRPLLRVGSVRIATDADDGTPRSVFEPLAAGTAQTVTLRFSLAGEATPKVVRDRRARILIAGQSLAMRVKVRAPR